MYLLDTDTVIYCLKGDQTVLQNLALHIQDPLRICSITLMELYYGAHKSKKKTSNLAKVRQIESAFDVVPVDRSMSETFGELKSALENRGVPLDDFDLVIASCALVHNITLVTNNIRHFQRVDGLKLDNWAK